MTARIVAPGSVEQIQRDCLRNQIADLQRTLRAWPGTGDELFALMRIADARGELVPFVAAIQSALIASAARK